MGPWRGGVRCSGVGSGARGQGRRWQGGVGNGGAVRVTQLTGVFKSTVCYTNIHQKGCSDITVAERFVHFAPATCKSVPQTTVKNQTHGFSYLGVYAPGPTRVGSVLEEWGVSTCWVGDKMVQILGKMRCVQPMFKRFSMF